MTRRAPHFILASRSPRRISLLREAGYSFDVQPSDVDEPIDDLLRDLRSPTEVARHLARAKARHVAQQKPTSIVLGSDTVVALNGQLLGTPVDRGDAERIIRNLAGSVHDVITAVCVMRIEPRFELLEHDLTRVHMRAMTEAEIQGHLDSGNWQGKAGAYGLQDNDPFVTQIEGSWSNVVGLPMEVVERLMSSIE
ncbi:MAG: Maf family protein [Tepidisphaeraceae bacterium]